MRPLTATRIPMAAGSSGPIPPPLPGNYLAYYEASNGPRDGSENPAVNYGEIAVWRDLAANGYDLNQPGTGIRLRTFPPISVYTDILEADAYLLQSSCPINRRAFSFFALVQNSQYWASVNQDHTIFELSDDAASLKYRIDGGTAVLVWTDSSEHVTTIPVPSSLSLIGIVLGASSVKVYCNDVSATFSALSAGTTAGFNVLGRSAGGEYLDGSVSCMILYDADVSASKAAIDTWAQGPTRGAKYVSQTGSTFLADGDSIGYGLSSENLLGFVQQADLGDSVLYTVAAGGQTWQALINHFAVERALYSITRRCVIWVNCGINDIILGANGVDTFAKACEFIALARDLGYLVIQNQLSDAGSAWLDVTKRGYVVDYNDLVANQDTEQFANVQIPVPAELTNSGDLVYFNADELHLTNRGHGKFTAAGQAAATALLAIPVTTLQAKWNFNGALTDSTEYKRHMVGVNSPTYTTGLNGKQCLVTAATGNRYVRYRYNNAFSLAFYPFTYMVWVKTTSNVYNDNYLRHDSNGIFFCQDAYTGMPHLYFTSASGSIDCGSNLATNDGVWHALAFVVDATGAKIYISPDGNAANMTLRGSAAWSGTPGPHNGAGYYLSIGSNNGSATIDANFQSPRMYAQALSLAELQAEIPE